MSAQPKRVRSVTRERVLDAADHAFGTKGYRATSINEIAKESGYTIGALYSNFTSKADLYMEVIERRMLRRRDFFEQAFRSAAQERRSVESLAESVSSALIPTSPWNLAVLEFAADATQDESLAPRLAELNNVARAMLREIIEANLGDMKDELALPMDRLVALTQCLVNGIGSTIALDPTVDADTVLKDGFAVLLRGLRTS
jgi:AcrR family transcriptional regulator